MNLNMLPAVVKRQIASAQIPVVYEEACAALAACRTIDEGKYWRDKAEALAAWAKIHRSDRAAIESRRLKLHAYRRMSELADELRPARTGTGKGGGKGSRKILEQHGFSTSEVSAMRIVGGLTEREFTKKVESDSPPSPHMIRKEKVFGSDAWRLLYNGSASCRSFCRGSDAVTVAKRIDNADIDKARELAVEISEWFDAFESALPKQRKARAA
jgi:hypothetical protein